MIGNRICAAAAATALAIFCSAAPASAASFDGSWNMALVTTSGHCGVIKIGMAVNRGHISATSGRFVMHKIFLAGLISGSGATKLNRMVKDAPLPPSGQQIISSPGLCSEYMASQHTGIRWFAPGYPPTLRCNSPELIST